MRKWGIAFVLLAALATALAQDTSTAAPAAAAQVSPPTAAAPEASFRQSMNDAWWTGPMLAPSANTLPRGHFLIEPYFFDVISHGRFDANGKRLSIPHSNGFGNLTYLNFGVTDRFTMGVIPIEGYNLMSQGLSSARVGVGDVSLLAQYRLTKYRERHHVPTISIALQERFPTGKFDRLGDRPASAQGGGAHTTELSTYAQYFFWLPNGRILRTRFNVTGAASDRVRLRDASVYGTSDGFRGAAGPGRWVLVDSSWEYSMKRGFVWAVDLTYEHDASTWVRGLDAASHPVWMTSGQSTSFAVAPAIEYSWRPNLGVLFGLRLFPAGRNSSASITPAIAINFFR